AIPYVGRYGCAHDALHMGGKGLSKRLYPAFRAARALCASVFPLAFLQECRYVLRRRHQVAPELLRKRPDELRDLLPYQARHEPLEPVGIELVQEVQRHGRGHPVQGMPRLEAVVELEIDARDAHAFGELFLRDTRG